MKQLLFLLFIFSVGCGHNHIEGNRNFLRRNDAIGQVHYGDRTYYIVAAAALEKVRKGPPTYVGTIENYHLFRVWLKIKDAPDEISFFAVRKTDCTIEDERSPEEEYAFTSSGREHRRVDFSNERCFVKKR